MTGSLQRTFSFADNDEESLSTNRFYENGHHPLPPAYTDSPVRQYSHNDQPPIPPQHQDSFGSRYHPPPLDTSASNGGDLGHSTSNRTASTTTPGADNLGEAAAGGGIAGVAFGVASSNARESGVEAMRSLESLDRVGAGIPQERGYNTVGSDNPYIPAPPSHRLSYVRDPFASPTPSRHSNPFDDNRGGSLPPSPGSLTPRGHQPGNSIPMAEYPQGAYVNSRGSSYLDNPYNRVSTVWDPMVARGDIDPDAIDDDGDDGIPSGTDSRYRPNAQRSSPENMSRAGAAASGGVLGTLGGLMSKKNGPNAARDTSGQYGPVGGPLSDPGGGAEKSEWLSRQTSGRKKLRWLVGIVIVLIILGGVAGGVVAAVRRSNSKSSATSSGGAPADKDDGQDLDKDSAEIKKLMGNTNLHKVFPGMDYTPFNAQYPACLTNPPSQNNVTKDVAVLSQLTNTIRLYGTDCNQTEMVLHAIDKLGLTDVKVWLGVWLDKNTTTNDRGINAMYDILDKNGADPFAGVIVGNEVLYRQQLTETNLAEILTNVKSNFTEKNINLPLATSDLGDNWTAGLAATVDVVMSNIHPFFGGVPVDDAAGWTWDFWQGKDVVLTENTSKKNIISEVGWPSGGGTDCSGGAKTCTAGAVAGVDEMNTFMDNFICQSLKNGTNFFW